MKKLSFIIIIIIASFQVNAQSKVGTIDVEYILSKMPQLEQVRSEIETYNKDLEIQINNKLASYQTLIGAYKKNESTFSEAIIKTKQDEIIALEEDIKTFQKNIAKLSQIKQDELVRPLYKQIGDALSAIATEEKFSQILTSNNIIAYLDPTFDITIKVMTRLGLPLPERGE